jgi:hypothetical protein
MASCHLFCSPSAPALSSTILSTSAQHSASSFCRLIWALVHSTTRSNQQRGFELAQAALDNDQRSQDQDRELRYYQSGV